MKFEPGASLTPAWRLRSPLREGAMGSVWVGERVADGGRVAIKVVHQRYSRDRETLARFEREAELAARLSNPNIVRLLDHGRTADGESFIVMELLEGETLQQRLERRGRLGLDDTAAILRQVGNALDHAHQRGVVHRDIKPDNVFLVGEDDFPLVKVLDFGVAKQIDPLRATDDSIVTKTGVAVGTPEYMAPEQLLGSKQIDHRCDLWALGAMVYRCLAGRVPFAGDSPHALFFGICRGEYTPLAEVGIDAELEDWFRRALCPTKEDRYDSARRMIEDLDHSMEVAKVFDLAGRDFDVAAGLDSHEGDDPRDHPGGDAGGGYGSFDDDEEATHLFDTSSLLGAMAAPPARPNPPPPAPEPARWSEDSDLLPLPPILDGAATLLLEGAEQPSGQASDSQDRMDLIVAAIEEARAHKDPAGPQPSEAASAEPAPEAQSVVHAVLAGAPASEDDASGGPTPQPVASPSPPPRPSRAAMWMALCGLAAAAGVAFFALGGLGMLSSPPAGVAPAAGRADPTHRDDGARAAPVDVPAAAAGSVSPDTADTAAPSSTAGAPSASPADTPATGKVTITCDPSCHVMWNGKRLGTSPVVDQEMPIGRQEIVVYRRGAGKKLVYVEIEPGKTTHRSIVMNDLPAKPPADAPPASSGDATPKGSAEPAATTAPPKPPPPPSSADPYDRR